MLHGIWLFIRLAQEIMLTNNVTKFDDDPLKNIQVTERTQFILAILANSRTITTMPFKRSGWLLNLAKRLCHQTMSQSLMMIHWKIFKLQSGHNLCLANLANSRAITPGISGSNPTGGVTFFLISLFFKLYCIDVKTWWNINIDKDFDHCLLKKREANSLDFGDFCQISISGFLHELILSID